MVNKYYFTLTKSNQCKFGSVESETTFEGVVTYEQDKETMQDVYEVTAVLTEFTQYQDGKKVSGFDSLRIPAHKVVVDLDAFEAECVERAFYEAELKIKKAA